MTQHTAEDEAHHPSIVGNTFMRQYYQFLAKEPQSLHRFYKDESRWCHGVGSRMEESISGQRSINEAIVRQGYEGARVDLDIGSIDCQGSLNGGVFVLVTGVMTLVGSPVPKPFVQTFFLAVQPKGYFVLNDCLRFLELPGVVQAPSVTPKAAPMKEAAQPKKTAKQAAIGTPVRAESPAAQTAKVKPQASPAPVPVVKPVPASPAAKQPTAAPPSSPVKTKTPVQSPVKAKVVTPVKMVESPAPAAPAAVASPKPKASPVKVTPAASPAVATPPAATEPAAPKTWAALFQANQAASALAAAVGAPIAPASTGAKAPAPKQSVPAPASPAPAAAPTTETPAPKEKEKTRYFSVYVKDVPAQTKESDIRELFTPYGAIANISVAAARGFAFVDFIDQESMRAAIHEDNTFVVHEKTLIVSERTERKDGQRSGFRTDTRGRGRGHGPKPRNTGDRKEDGKERREPSSNGRPTTNSNGPQRQKSARRGGKVDAAPRAE